jgi:hypothetical protein
LICFFAHHRQAIFIQGLFISHEIFGDGALLEPLFFLMAEFESRRARFDMRERQLAKFHAGMRQLTTRYEHEPDFPACCELLSNSVSLRFASENHDLPPVAHAPTVQSKLKFLAALEASQEDTLFLDGVDKEIGNDEAVARAVMLLEPELPESEEQEEEESAKPPQPLEGIILAFNRDLVESQLRVVADSLKFTGIERGTF